MRRSAGLRDTSRPLASFDEHPPDDAGAGILATFAAAAGWVGVLVLLRRHWAPIADGLFEVLAEPPIGLVGEDAEVFVLAAGGFPALFALGLILAGASDRARARRRRARTVGEVESVRHETRVRQGAAPGEGTRNVRVVVFSFEVEGERIEAKHEGRGGGMPGASVTVHYDPVFPKNAGLRPPWRERAYLSGLVLIAGLTLVVVGLFAKLG